ncbi:MAG: dihydrodipicolinate synthase family protein, partial [Clostridia bacterium]|nr:dihydrodipicolinate synthase family protein [Clostridia bacterium]
ANGNISKIVETMSLVHDKLDLYSGNDDQIVPLMSLGGQGVISVLSNLLPRETSEMCHAFLRGDIAAARATQFKYHKLIDALFSEVNPIPVKAAMTRLGFGDGSIRLPLTPMTAVNEEKLVGLMREAGIEV